MQESGFIPYSCSSAFIQKDYLNTSEPATGPNPYNLFYLPLKNKSRHIHSLANKNKMHSENHHRQRIIPVVNSKATRRRTWKRGLCLGSLHFEHASETLPPRLMRSRIAFLNHICSFLHRTILSYASCTLSQHTLRCSSCFECSGPVSYFAGFDNFAIVRWEYLDHANR